jgi:glutamate dehydrogenase/leucine dehydrogenase
VLVLPDFIVNAGGMICAAVEHRGGRQGEALERIAEKIHANVTEVLQRAEAAGGLPRQAAIEMARERVVTAMRFRRTW